MKPGQQEFYSLFTTVDVNAVWRAREAEQAAKNHQTLINNLPRGHKNG